MALSTGDQARLAALQNAYDKLISGQKTATAQWGNTRVEYTAGDATRLKAEIDTLNARAATTGRTRGAVRFRI